MTEILDKVYDPQRIEEKWYQYWEEQGFFRAKADGAKPGYCIVIPPPNVTGVLHLGHALNNTLQDILIRCQRMDGFDALWLPGTDHAGIATQTVVERQLPREGRRPPRPRPRGLPRARLGVEGRIRRAHHHPAQAPRLLLRLEPRALHHGRGLSAAVREVFVRLYEEGLIYRGDYIINWCCTPSQNHL